LFFEAIFRKQITNEFIPVFKQIFYFVYALKIGLIVGKQAVNFLTKLHLY